MFNLQMDCRFKPIVAAALVCVLSQFVLAQNAPTTVQLPTFNQFSVGTSVLVPDGGSTLLGGVNSHSSGMNSVGVPMLGNLPGIGRAFNNRAFGVNDRASQVRVKATIIDLQEMDAAIRNSPEARRVRERMGGFFAGDNLINGKGGIQGGGIHAGVRRENEVTRRAMYLTENMGRSSKKVARKRSSAVKVTPKQKASMKTKAAEPPLLLKGKK